MVYWIVVIRPPVRHNQACKFHRRTPQLTTGGSQHEEFIMPEQWIALLVVGLVAGVAAGLFGIGGGVIIVPALTILLGFELKKATGTSLTALLMPVGIFAVIAYYRAGKLKISTAAWVALGIIISSYIGAQIALGLDTNILKQLYGIFLLYVAWRFIEPRKWQAQIRQHNQEKETPAATPAAEPETTVSWYILLIVGLVAGILSGMFGIGGGVVIVPALVALLKMDQKRAVGTSLAALLLPVSLPGVISYYEKGQLDIPVAALVAAGLVVGAIAGARIALGLPSGTVKRLYGIFLLFVAARFILGF
jgi:uncharacterized protein